MKKIILLLLLVVVFLIENNTAQTTSHKMDVKTLWSLDSVTPAPVVNKDTIEMSIGTLKDYGGGQFVVELEPKVENSDYVLPIVIGQCEMRGIVSKKNNEIPPRPMTYDVMTNIMKATGAKLTKIVVTKLEGGTYYAVLMLISNNKKIELDSRPSDAINLAMRSNVPVCVLRSVFDEAKELKAK